MLPSVLSGEVNWSTRLLFRSATNTSARHHGLTVQRRADRDATGFAHAGRRCSTKCLAKFCLSDDRISGRVNARSRGRVEFEHPAILQIDYIKVAADIELDIDRFGQRTCARAGASEISAAAGEIGLAKNAIGSK